IKEVLLLVTWVAALLVARVYSETLSELMVNAIDSDSVRYVTAFALIFVVVMMAGTLFNHLLSKLLTITGLKAVDRLLGGVFGVARGVIIVLVILFISSVFVSETEQWQQSTLIPHGMTMIEWSRVFIEDMNSINLGQ
ncbi:MAG: CvpA family protein, partial [Gammaproteobacteria bacterium]|nr:CvpA family protein [Gammaproteobacteria bacterium]